MKKQIGTIIILGVLLISIITLSVYINLPKEKETCSNVDLGETSSFWTNHSGEWENYVVVVERGSKAFYKNGERTYSEHFGVWDRIQEEVKLKKEAWEEINNIILDDKKQEDVK